MCSVMGRCLDPDGEGGHIIYMCLCRLSKICKISGLQNTSGSSVWIMDGGLV